MKNTLLLLLLSLLLWSCSKDSPYAVDFQAETETLASLDAEIASFLDLTYHEAGLISKVTEQIRVQKLDEADLTSEELIARLDISEEELAHFSEKMSSLQVFVEQNGYSEEQVSYSVELQMTNRFGSLEKGTPCYDQHIIEVGVASVTAVACIAVAAAATAGWGIPICTISYVAAVGLSNNKYLNCIRSRTGG